MKGFLLLKPGQTYSYRGVDRNPFEPVIFSDLIDPDAYAQTGESRTWVFYPPGWRRDAYRLYEENSVSDSGDDLILLSSIEVAKSIQQIIELHIGFYEIVACEIWRLGRLPLLEEATASDFLGYDVAYPGGDFYSAILNGLFINPSPLLVKEFKHLLNGFGLFSSTKPILRYLHDFRNEVLSEAKSEFCVFGLSRQDR